MIQYLINLYYRWIILVQFYFVWPTYYTAHVRDVICIILYRFDADAKYLIKLRELWWEKQYRKKGRV